VSDRAARSHPLPPARSLGSASRRPTDLLLDLLLHLRLQHGCGLLETAGSGSELVGPLYRFTGVGGALCERAGCCRLRAKRAQPPPAAAHLPAMLRLSRRGLEKKGLARAHAPAGSCASSTWWRCARVRACVRACVRVRACVCVCVCVCVRMWVCERLHASGRTRGFEAPTSYRPGMQDRSQANGSMLTGPLPTH
jgi:hypothetical protein